MSVFFENVCKFGGCGLRFADVYDLIQHIEERHYHVEQANATLRHMAEATQHQQVAKCALSVLSRYYVVPPERKALPVRAEPMQCALRRHKPPQPTAASSAGAGSGGGPAFAAAGGHSPLKTPGKQIPASARKRKLADGDSLSVTSDDRSFSARSDHTNSEAQETASGSDAVFAKSDERRIPCPVKNCSKVYKNMNGVRYHLRIMHPNEHGATPESTGSSRPYKCTQCPSKAYKTAAGLTNHIAQMHGTAAQAARTANAGVTASTSCSGAAGASQWASSATISSAPVSALGTATAARTLPVTAQTVASGGGANVVYRHQTGAFNSPANSVASAVRKAI